MRNTDWLKLYKLSIKLSERVPRGDKIFSQGKMLDYPFVVNEVTEKALNTLNILRDCNRKIILKRELISTASFLPVLFGFFGDWPSRM